ncbi:MAG: hypothetical protein IAG13_00725 [Deltaproteobacteria bacterium]|nr:hypothetical protein [Nannocystaceae bacterium]
MSFRAPSVAAIPDSHRVHRHLAAERVGMLVVAASLLACGGGDDGESATNVLPTQGATEESSGAGTVASMSMSTTEADSTDGEPQGIPVAYRFECIDIQVLGDADGTSFQANLLEDTWSDDIDDYKLNIMFEVQERDASAGTARVGIRSGIGSGAGDLCSEPSSESDVIDVLYEPEAVLWAPSADDGACSVAGAAGAPTDGSYTMTLGPDVLVYIYAQDTDGVTFNCTADDALPDAVPVRAVEAQLTTSADGSSVSGTLTGCLLGSEAQALCSCLGQCNAAMPNENCGGCPDGSVPLRDLLVGINPSTRCSDLTGADAFDLTLGFNASALPAIPTQCGGG